MKMRLNWIIILLLILFTLVACRVKEDDRVQVEVRSTVTTQAAQEEHVESGISLLPVETKPTIIEESPLLDLETRTAQREMILSFYQPPHTAMTQTLYFDDTGQIIIEGAPSFTVEEETIAQLLDDVYSVAQSKRLFESLGEGAEAYDGCQYGQLIYRNGDIRYIHEEWFPVTSSPSPGMNEVFYLINAFLAQHQPAR